MCVASFPIFSVFAKERPDSSPMALKSIYILLLTSWFVFELDWRAVILAQSFLILYSHSQDKRNREFNYSVNYYIITT